MRHNVYFIVLYCVFILPMPVYMEGFVVAASNLPGNIFTIIVMDRVGGKTLLCKPGNIIHKMYKSKKVHLTHIVT